MEPLLQWIENWPGAVFLQRSATSYVYVNAAHILGIGVLFGAILPLDLRLAGCFRSLPLAVLEPVLSRFAAAGLFLAILTGSWLFSVRADEYVANTAFVWKMGLLFVALLTIVLQHKHPAFRRALDGEALEPRVRVFAVASMSLWLSVLVAGRWIGFL